MPLIVSAPGLLAPRRVAAPVSLLDVAPTILDLLGLPGLPDQRGVSLVAAANGERDGRGRGAADLRRGRSRRAPAVPLRRGAARRPHRDRDLTDGTTRCYAADDPGELHPTGGCPDLEARIAEHRRAMTPVGTQAPEAVDPRLIEKMRALGYVQ